MSVSILSVEIPSSVRRSHRSLHTQAAFAQRARGMATQSFGYSNPSPTLASRYEPEYEVTSPVKRFVYGYTVNRTIATEGVSTEGLSKLQ
jgi:hypothetical protein